MRTTALLLIGAIAAAMLGGCMSVTKDGLVTSYPASSHRVSKHEDLLLQETTDRQAGDEQLASRFDESVAKLRGDQDGAIVKLRDDLADTVTDLRNDVDPTPRLEAAKQEFLGLAASNERLAREAAEAARAARTDLSREQLGQLQTVIAELKKEDVLLGPEGLPPVDDPLVDYGVPGATSLLAMFLLNAMRNKRRRDRGEAVTDAEAAEA